MPAPKNGSRTMAGFQSLSGFQVRCNVGSYALFSVYDMVSIPIGFSSSLQLARYQMPGSIRDEFQSLSGFQVRCNVAANESPIALTTGFNPYRVFKFVATFLCLAFDNRKALVSIPIGFSSSLQRRKCRWSHRLCGGFNPYRVFKFVATLGGTKVCRTGQ